MDFKSQLHFMKYYSLPLSKLSVQNQLYLKCKNPLKVRNAIHPPYPPKPFFPKGKKTVSFTLISDYFS